MISIQNSSAYCGTVLFYKYLLMGMQTQCRIFNLAFFLIMRKYIFIVFFLILARFGYSQTNSLIGKWKVVAIDNGEVYYNAKTDSVSIISEDLKEMYDDESKILLLKDNIKKLYINNQLEFQQNGVFVMETIIGVLESNYIDEPKRGVIIHESRNSLNAIIKEEMPYKFVDGQLHFAMSPEMIFTLEKAK